MVALGMVFWVAGWLVCLAGWRAARKLDRRDFRYDYEYDRERDRIVRDTAAAFTWIVGIGSMFVIFGAP